MQIAGGGFHNVLVIGADALSRYVDWTDRGTCILFGDAAGAVLVQVVFFSIKIFIGNILCIDNKYMLESTILVKGGVLLFLCVCICAYDYLFYWEFSRLSTS